MRFRPPATPIGVVPRERVTAAIAAAIDADGVTVLSAPSGYGKTTAVAAWASSRDDVAWLALSASDDDPALLTAGVLNALALAAERAGRVFAAPRDIEDPMRAYRQICAAFQDAEHPVYLVVDDAHRAGEAWGDGLLGMLADQPPDGLRLLLVGTTLIEVTLSRHRLMHPGAFVGVDTLRFSADEIRSLTRSAPGGLDAAAVRDETGGWPIAVRLVLVGGSLPSSPASTASSFLGAYIREHVLDALPPALADFVLEGTACAELTPDTAAQVTARDDAADLLETCVRLGLFLDRFDGPEGPTYRWHPAFARRCADLARTDAARFATVHRRAARALEHTDPIAAVTHARRAGDPAGARAILLRHWLGLVVGSSAVDVERTATTLLRDNPDDPHLLLVRAGASDVLGDHRVARELCRRAEALLDRTPGQADPAVLLIVRLLLAESSVEVAVSGAEIRALLDAEDDRMYGGRVALNHLLGWTALRNRESPDLAIEYFSAAAREARQAGDRELTSRAVGHLAYGLATSGRLTEAAAVLAEAESTREALPPRNTFARGSAVAAAGWVAYWSGEAEEAVRIFDAAREEAASGRDLAGHARMMGAYAAALTGDPGICRRAAISVQELPIDVVQGVAWPAFRESSVALLEEAVGRRERALRIAMKYAGGTDLPLVGVALSGILRRAEEHAAALEMLRSLRGASELSYVKAATLITAAALRRATGHQEDAHDLCEAALAVASAENLVVLFGPREVAVRRLLQAHVHHGTQFEGFIERCLAVDAVGSVTDRLSERERDVFHQMQTARTLPEIAQELRVSVNTVKTHQRAIYRKLGVSSRREAVHATV